MIVGLFGSSDGAFFWGSVGVKFPLDTFFKEEGSFFWPNEPPFGSSRSLEGFSSRGPRGVEGSFVGREVEFWVFRGLRDTFLPLIKHHSLSPYTT